MRVDGPSAFKLRDERLPKMIVNGRRSIGSRVATSFGNYYTVREVISSLYRYGKAVPRLIEKTHLDILMN